jgi:hypothetical protein
LKPVWFYGIIVIFHRLAENICPWEKQTGETRLSKEEEEEEEEEDV